MSNNFFLYKRNPFIYDIIIPNIVHEREFTSIYDIDKNLEVGLNR